MNAESRPSRPMRTLLVNPHRTDPESADAPGPNFHQHRFETPGKICSSTNLGLVSLATALTRSGVEVEVLNLDGRAYPLDEFRRTVRETAPELIGVSCLFHSTYLSLYALAAAASEDCPDARIVAGGNHVANIAQYALDDVKVLDAVIVGEAEAPLLRMVQTPPVEWPGIDGVRTRLGGQGVGKALPLGELNIREYPGYEAEVLVIEESRGCPFDCSFCWHTRSHRKKPLEVISKELKQYLEHTTCSAPEVIIASDTLGLSRARLRGLLNVLEGAQTVRSFRWGSQTRADCLAFAEPSVRELASRSGLRSLSIGLESASPQVLATMRKCKKPDAYVDSARAILENIGPLPGTRVRLNILLYPGENRETLGQTRAFLERNRHLFAGIHTSVAHAYPGTRLWNELSELEATFGTTRVRGPYWESVRAYPLNPSRQLDFDDANDIALRWRAEFKRC